MKINDLFCRGRRNAPPGAADGGQKASGGAELTPHPAQIKTPRRAAAGCAVGAVNGVFGGGGGIIVVPLLTGVGKKPPLVAHATAILVILPVCIASAAVYLANGWFDAELFVAVSIGMLAGGVAGAKLLGAVSPAAATLVFAAVMCAAGVRMLV